VGAVISKAGAERTTPLSTATLVVAANAPDVDMLAFVEGEYFALAFRRGVTHGVPALVVLPFAVTALVLSWDRWVRRRREPGADPARAGPVLALSVAGLLTHPALDWMNTYGMRWWLPFDGSWSYGDALFIIDPWIWLVLGGAVFLTSAPGRLGLGGWGVLALLTSALVWLALRPLAGVVWTAGVAAVLAVRVLGAWWAPRKWRDARPTRERRAGAERRAARRPTPDDRVVAARPARSVSLARAAAAAVLLYILAMVAADAGARQDVARAAAAEGLTVRDLMVAPARGNPFASDVEIRTDDAFVPGVHHWLRRPRVELFPDTAVPLLSAPAQAPRDLVARVVEDARRTPSVRNYLVWSRYPYVRVDPEGGGWRVRFSDARYDGQPGTGGLSGVRVHVPEEGRQ
jgi:inner membrane protein